MFNVQECKEWKTLNSKPIVSGWGGSLDQDKEYNLILMLWAVINLFLYKLPFLKFDKSVLPCRYRFFFFVTCLPVSYSITIVTRDRGLQKFCKLKGCNTRINMLPIQWFVGTISCGFRKAVKCRFIQFHLIVFKNVSNGLWTDHYTNRRKGMSSSPCSCKWV